MFLLGCSFLDKCTYQDSPEYLKGTVFSSTLFAELSSCILPYKPSRFNLPRLNQGRMLGFDWDPTPRTFVWDLQAISNHGARLTCFSSFIDPSLTPVGLFFYFIYFVWFSVVSRGKVNPLAVTSSALETNLQNIIKH